MKFRTIAMIPARSGSKRVKNKNIRMLGNHPLLAYAIIAAQKSEIFSDIICSSDSLQYLGVAEYYGAKAIRRPYPISDELASDKQWVKHALEYMWKLGKVYDVYFILRPTNPFRTAGTICRAWESFKENQPCDSLRAVRVVSQHPNKMWRIAANDMGKERMQPLLSDKYQAYFDMPYQALDTIFVQTGALQIGWTDMVMNENTLSGDYIMPFYMPDGEDFDINTENDWKLAEAMYKVKTCSK
ncbi:MAG: acylneuraminate cytidylyltransferase family protein [Bacteroidetes bacterium]|nr:MAG: acylneuraminate cytidylyltransferase family protein [Bacteroidota bacterium]